MAEDLHRLLLRQLARVRATVDHPPADREGWRELLSRIDRAYRDADSERYTVERSLDISSREMAELHEHLTAERDKVTAVLGAVRAAVLEVSPDKIVRYGNPSALRMFGADIVGKRFREVIQLEDPDGSAHERIVRELGTRPTVHQSDGGVRVNGGPRIEVAWTISTLGKHSDAQAYVLTITDLTDQRQAQRDLTEARVDAEVARRTERTRARFLANMSHELRTPLNAVIGYAEMLREEDPAASGDLERILRSARHLLALINDVLDLAKVDAGRMDLVLEDIDVRTLVADTVATMRPLAEREGNVLEAIVHPDVPEKLRTDRMRLIQCLHNLLSNAAKFTRNGRIGLEVESDGGAVAFSVSDQGIGISPDALARLFQPFVQADASTTRAYGGTGLGLALTRAFVERLGGAITVRSQVGRGSTFRMRLPALVAERAPPTAQWSSGDSDQVVLVVDDDPIVFELVAHALAELHVRVIGVSRAEHALSTAIANRPRVVLLDVVLPGAYGWFALYELRAHPATQDVPVIVVSSSDDARRTAERLHADGCLCKPIQRRALIELVRPHLLR